MTPPAPALFGGSTALLVAAAALAVVSAGHADPARSERGAEFQRVLGGLGLGPATDLAHCERSFDLRVGSACAEQLEPIPGGAVPCGHGGAGADR